MLNCERNVCIFVFGNIISVLIPQFIEARLPWSEIPEAEEESLIQPDAANKKE